MTSVQSHYAELLKLTRQFLFQEYKTDQRIYSETSSYEYFRQHAINAKGMPPSNPTAPAMPLKPSIVENKALQPIINPNPHKISQPINTEKPSNPPPPSTTTTTSQQPSIDKAPKLQQAADPLPPVEAPKGKKENTSFVLEPLGPAAQVHFGDIRKMAEERLPNYQFIQEIPNDREARLKNELKVDEALTVAVISFGESPKQLAFLTNIVKALEAHGEIAKIIHAPKIENENAWDVFLKTPSLRLTIASGHCIESCPQLHQHYRESAKHAKNYLGNKPLLQLSDISFYMKEPKLKLSLWEALKILLQQS